MSVKAEATDTRLFPHFLFSVPFKSRFNKATVLNPGYTIFEDDIEPKIRVVLFRFARPNCLCNCHMFTQSGNTRTKEANCLTSNASHPILRSRARSTAVCTG